MKTFLTSFLILIAASKLTFAAPAPIADVETWLIANPSVANAIKWQTTPGSGFNGAYVVPESAKIAWPNWSKAERKELIAAFNYAYQWFFFHASDWSDNIDTIPETQIVQGPNDTPVCYADATYARQLYIRWVAHSLMLEIYQVVPWSITTYTDAQLADLLDSSRFMRRLNNGTFALGFDNFTYEPSRKDVFGDTLISTPIYTYKFLRSNLIILPSNLIMPAGGVVAVKKIQVIENLLTWCKNNMTHFYGGQSVSNFFNHWQYAGPAPFVRIAEGTHYINSNGVDFGFSHWTAGCQGTGSFLAHALRAVNIPVENAVICQYNHFAPTFPTEGIFLSHADNPYNADFQASGLPVSYLLLSDLFFEPLFGIPFTSPLNPYSSSCQSAGYSIDNLFQ